MIAQPALSYEQHCHSQQHTVTVSNTLSQSATHCHSYNAYLNCYSHATFQIFTGDTPHVTMSIAVTVTRDHDHDRDHACDCDRDRGRDRDRDGTLTVR